MQRQVAHPVQPQTAGVRPWIVGASVPGRIIGHEVGDPVGHGFRRSGIRVAIGHSPLLVRRGQMPVAKPALAGAVRPKSNKIVRTPRPGRAAVGRWLRLPPRGPAIFGDPRHIVVIEHRLQHGQQLIRRLARDLERFLVAADPQIAMLNADRFPGQTDQPFNKIRPRIGLRPVAGKLEHDHVPPLGFGEIVSELAHQNAIAAVRGIRLVLRIAGPQQRRIAAHRTGARHGLKSRSLRRPVGGYLVTRADLIIAPARRAIEIFMAPHQRRGHRPGGDHERLGLERAEQERQDEGDHDRLDRLAHGRRRGQMPGNEIGRWFLAGRPGGGIAGMDGQGFAFRHGGIRGQGSGNRGQGWG